MANLCFTEYRLTGDAEQLKSLYNTMLKLQSMEKPFLAEVCDKKNWLGNLVAKFGKDWQKIGCRGSWHGLMLSDDILSFATESAWNRCEDVEYLLRDRFPGIDISFRAEEGGCGIFETNDFNTFPEKYLVYDSSFGEDEYCLDDNDLIKTLSRHLGKTFDTLEEAMKAVKQYNEESEDYINVNEFEYAS